MNSIVQEQTLKNNQKKMSLSKPANSMISYRTCFSSVSHHGYKLDMLKSGMQKYLRRREFEKMTWCVMEIFKFELWAKDEKEKKMSTDQIWLIVGFIGQTVFASRFLIQWIVSERASKSIIPNIFWWISLAGSMILLSYAIHKLDPVFIMGQSCGFLIYSRNLYLIKKEGKNKKNDPSKIMKV